MEALHDDLNGELDRPIVREPIFNRALRDFVDRIDCVCGGLFEDGGEFIDRLGVSLLPDGLKHEELKVT